MAKLMGGRRTNWAKSASRFATPQGGPIAKPAYYPPTYNKSGISGQIIPPNRGQYPRGHSLPGYVRTPSSASEAMTEYARRSGLMRNQMTLGRFGSMAGRLLPIAGVALNAYEWWRQTAEPSDQSQLYFPTGWQVPKTGECDRGLPRQKYWGINDGACTGIRNFNMQNQVVLAGTGVNRGWYCHITTALGDNGTPVNPYKRNVRGFLPQPTGTTFPAEKTPTNTRVVPRPSQQPYVDTPPYPETSIKGYPKPAPRIKPKDRYFGPRLPPRGTTEFPDYPHVPPPPNVKEKKGLVIGAGKAGRAYGALTEFRDFADCLAGAIPGNPCGKYRNQLHKYAACIAQHEAAVNMPEAIACFFGSQARDTAIGRPAGIFQRGAAKGSYWSRPVGPGAGNWAVPSVPRMTPI